ncbi:MAG TPA: translation initiation factor IF-3 [Anaerolineae bacterium]|nr:translation initiation factor IF-3 [Anaerolineae bacterium]
MNEAITASEVRVIDDEGKQVGVFPIREALRLAQERDVDLVEVAPAARPPVCRLLNYGKFLYERTKKERQARKAQKTIEIKEIRMQPKIGAHDLDFKRRRVREFLADGAKVRIRVRFRGRERSYPEIGQALLERLVATLTDVAVVEQMPTIEEGAGSIYVLVAPKVSVHREVKPGESAEAADSLQGSL